MTATMKPTIKHRWLAATPVLALVCLAVGWPRRRDAHVRAPLDVRFG